jgi:exodeoxyribonuclease VII small subunit
MKKELDYKQAFARLETLVDLLEEGTIDLEALPEKISEANNLIDICNAKLRHVELQVEAAAPPGSKTKQK